jgi:DNA-directed RNA polymerase subunit RPC12/RpoP
MKTLDQHNKETLDYMYEHNKPYPRKNGLACPKCGSELMDTDGYVYASSPPQRGVNCSKCDYRGYRY